MSITIPSLPSCLRVGFFDGFERGWSSVSIPFTKGTDRRGSTSHPPPSLSLPPCVCVRVPVVGIVSNPKDRNERKGSVPTEDRTFRSWKRRGGGGHTSSHPPKGWGRRTERFHPQTQRRNAPPPPPLPREGENRGSSACFVHSYRGNEGRFPVRCTPYPKHAEENQRSLRTVGTPSFSIVSHPPFVDHEHGSSKEGSQTSRPRCSLVHTFGWTSGPDRKVDHRSSRRRLHDPRPSERRPQTQANALHTSKKTRRSKP